MGTTSVDVRTKSHDDAQFRDMTTFRREELPELLPPLGDPSDDPALQAGIAELRRTQPRTNSG